MEVSILGEADTGTRATYAIDCDGVFTAFAIPNTSEVEVLFLLNLAARPLRLSSEWQLKPITALCLGYAALGTSDPPARPASGGGGGSPNPSQQALLCTASRDVVLVWNLVHVFDAVARGVEPPQPVQVLADPGVVEAVVINSEQGQLAVCAGVDVHIFELKTLRHLFRCMLARSMHGGIK